MLVFPISESAPTGCRFEQPEDGTHCLRFRCENQNLHAYSVVTEPQEDAYVLLDSFISGGSFSEYLVESMERFASRICLYLRPQAMRFPLPCPDGRGEVLGLEELDHNGFQYSETLCCLWRICTDGGTYIELTDSDRSLREKFQIAEACGVPLLIAEEDTLAKVISVKG